MIDYAAMLYPEAQSDIKLIQYNEDQWSAKLGLAHVWNQKVAEYYGAALGLWGLDNPASTT